MSKLLRTFKQTYKLKPGCHPLLSLTRLALDRLLHEGSFLDTKNRMQLAESVNLGLAATIGPEHPVSAIHLMVFARLRTVEPIPDWPVTASLSMAAMTMRTAHNKLVNAFGPGNSLAEDAAQQVGQIEQEIHLARHHGAVRSR